MKTSKLPFVLHLLAALAILSGCGQAPKPAQVTLADLQITNAQASVGMTRCDARAGSKIRIEGTSNIHDWQVEGSLIGGYLEAGPGFPLEPGQAVTPGKVPARAEAFIPVRGLKSVEKDGKPYSDMMDKVMYEHLKVADDPKARIAYYLTEVVLKEPAKSNGAPYLFDSRGQLVVAGVTNEISMPVNVLPLGEKKLRISGSIKVKMTDFKVEPPCPALAVGLIKTGDEVKLIFEWNVGPKAVPAATSSK